MKALRLALVASALAALAACGDGDRVKSPHAQGKLTGPLAVAFREEATGDQVKAVDLYVRALDNAATSPDDPESIPVAMAALDALVHRSVSAFSDVGTSSALADRVPPSALKPSLDARLARVQEHAEGPFAAALVAEARLALAERRGDAANADALRVRTGCVRSASVVGPISYTPVSTAGEPTTVDVPGTPAPAEVKGPGPFLPRLAPGQVTALGCHLPLYAQLNAHGVRDVVVDVDVPKAGWLGVAIRTNSAAVVRAGGQLAVERSNALGQGPVSRFATIEAASAGTLRVVARVGMDSDFETVQLGVWDEDGKPLRSHAPVAGAKANVAIKRAIAQATPAPKSDDDRLAAALGALAARESRTAENLLHGQVARTDAPPELLLAYARAVRLARDLPGVKSSERARTAYERVLETWPASWEAIVEHAVLAGVRVGRAESNIEALNDLDKTRAKGKSGKTTPALLDAFDAVAAGREHLYDRARSSYDRAKSAIDGTTLLRGIERLAFERTGRENEAFDCDARAAGDRTSLACYNAKLTVGDRNGAELELQRLRALAGAPQLYLSLSTRDALEVGNLQLASALQDRMNPGDRQIGTMFAVKGKAATPDLLRFATIARDAPGALPSLLRAAGDDPIAPFEGIAERVANDDKTGPLLANAATAILAHQERYDVEPNGLTHFTMLDVRRVMGTTDVESNAEASSPLVYGRDTIRILRRRILKKDGRILLPDATPRAAQSHADLSQLEAGDAVEAIYEGWGIPGEMGNMGIDTPDLLPERTAVRDASIEFRLPPGLTASVWSHPMLGKAEERTEQGKRVLTWRMKDRSVRRVEYGVPKMDRNVGVSISTTTWEDVGRGLRETVAALDADSPEVTAWARALDVCDGKPCGPSRALVDKVVAASGQAVKEASGILLADMDLGRAGGQTTARTMLATHEGSRTWLVVRALRELGIHTDIVVAENDPFSDSPSFPPHFGRFMHPLAVAHVPSAKDPGVMEDVWIDADVPGPPLPAGRISPELRGRQALRDTGRIGPLPNLGGDGERDEIDERLVIDDEGNAKGSLTVLLRGRSAQDLAEALVRLVGNERQRALRGIALAWVPFATVEKVELSSTEGSWQVAIRAELTAPAYAQVEGIKVGTRTWVLPGLDPVHYVFPRPYTTSLSATYATQGSRESALAINHASQYHMRRRVELPPRASFLRLPGPFDGKGPLMSASRTISVSGNTVEEDFTLDVSTGTVPQDKYDAFVTETHRADDGFRASLRVKPPAP
ncbi:MAG: hypothetical protein JWP97_2980 [Labilithrix sp.]|nr:hypothetical protein [Labilithrix sp.]